MKPKSFLVTRNPLGTLPILTPFCCSFLIAEIFLRPLVILIFPENLSQIDKVPGVCVCWGRSRAGRGGGGGGAGRMDLTVLMELPNHIAPTKQLGHITKFTIHTRSTTQYFHFWCLTSCSLIIAQGKF